MFFDNGASDGIPSIELDGLEKFDSDDQNVDIPVLEGLQTYEIDKITEQPKQSEQPKEVVVESIEEIDSFDPAVDKSDDIFSAFEDDNGESEKDDPFASFGDDITEKSADDLFGELLNEETVTEEQSKDIQVEEEVVEAEPTDMFSELIPEEVIDNKPEVEQIDMSDIIVEQTDTKDIFEDIVAENEVEIIEKQPDKKIIIDADDIKQDEKSGKDIFDMEI